MISPTVFGRMPDGTLVHSFALENADGTAVTLISYGAIVASVRVRDRAGRIDDIVIGHETLDGYRERSRFFGAVVGRYTNRIANGRFALDGDTYQLATNNGRNHLHGGIKGWDKLVWSAEPFTSDRQHGVVFSRISPDGEEGYPGTVHVGVTYTLTSQNELVLEYEATTDAATPINLTNHSYFNLAGEGRGDVLDHEVTIEADAYTPADAGQIPTGEIAPVAGTPFDFRKPTRVGARIDADHEQLRLGGGYDHNFVLSRKGDALARVAHVVEPRSGRTLTVSTTEPGLQFYSGNKLDGSITGKHGHVYGKRSGLCLETQHFPDSPNHPNFPSTILRPGQKFVSKTVFSFGVS